MTAIDPTRGDAPGETAQPVLSGTIASVLGRWPSAGLAAVAVIRDGEPGLFFCHGVADVRSQRLVTRDTVFRIASLTKTVTAVAVTQLCEQGLVDLDAPANDSLDPSRKRSSPPQTFGRYVYPAGPAGLLALAPAWMCGRVYAHSQERRRRARGASRCPSTLRPHS